MTRRTLTTDTLGLGAATLALALLGALAGPTSAFASPLDAAANLDATLRLPAVPAEAVAPLQLTTPQVVTHCYWVCYPGSGCEYVCRSFPW